MPPDLCILLAESALLHGDHVCLRGFDSRLSLMSSRHSSQAVGWHRPGWLRQSSRVLPGGICSGDGSGCGLPLDGGAAVKLLAVGAAVGTAASRRRAMRLLLAPGKRAAAGPTAQSSRTKPRVARHRFGR